MSYILDALKKSEQERDLGRIPTLTDAPPADASGSNRKNLPVIGALLLAMLAVLLALYAVFNGHFLESTDPLESPRIASIGINASAPEPPGQTDTAGTPAPVNLPTIDNYEEAVEEKKQPHPTAPPISSTEKTTAADLKPRTLPEAMPPKEAIPTASPTATSIARPLNSAKRSEQPAPLESAAVKTSKPPDVVLPPQPEKTVSTDSVARRSAAPQAMPEVKHAEVEKTAKIVVPDTRLPVIAVRKARPGTEHTLPYDVYRRLPKRKISAMAYSDVPERRFVIVNSKKMREKESTEQGLEVVEIMDDGVVFSFQGHRFFKQLIP